jgi:chitin disaccharide deacetylase
MQHVIWVVFMVALGLAFARCVHGAGGAPEIRLLIRADDMASSHAANLACIQSCRDGIARSVEIMAPCAWFPEAVKLLNENPGLDVGVHLTLTSEWEKCKWRPLTFCPSLVDADGFFFPVIWPRAQFPASAALTSRDWKIEEIEREFRAQIELVKRHVPRTSHLSFHMGCSDLDPRVKALCRKLAAECVVDIDPEALGVAHFPLRGKAETAEQRIADFIDALKKLEPGKTYLYIEHPGFDTPEMQGLGHAGYEDVARDRDAVTRTFTDDRVKKTIQERPITLISYKDLRTGS